MSSSITCAVAVVLLLGAFGIGARSAVLRDNSTSPRPPYSFSRVQLFWWVVLITFCFLDNIGQSFLSGHLDAPLPKLNETCLVLLGIGVGTTTVAQVLDSRQRIQANLQGTPLAQDAMSAGFLTDILSDETGLSVHRLQALVFNLIYGVSFVAHFVSNSVFDSYGQFEFAVLGLSDAAYLGLKALENNPLARVNPTPTQPIGEVLLDAGTTATHSDPVG